MTKCYLCEKGTLHKKKVDYVLLGEDFGKFDAEVCDKCGEEFFDEKVSMATEKIAKEKGLFGIEARTKIAEVGNSYCIRIPKKIFEFMSLKKGEEVLLIPENKKRLVIDVAA